MSSVEDKNYVDKLMTVLWVGHAGIVGMLPLSRMSYSIVIGGDPWVGSNRQGLSHGCVLIGDSVRGSKEAGSECVIKVDDLKSITEDPAMARQFINYYHLILQFMENLKGHMRDDWRIAALAAIETIRNKCREFITTPAGYLWTADYIKGSGVSRTVKSLEIRPPIEDRYTTGIIDMDWVWDDFDHEGDDEDREGDDEDNSA